jgi:hypothetical protein
MIIQSETSLISFEAADNSAEMREMRDVAAFHEDLMRGSSTYADAFRAATQFGPIHVIVNNTLEGPALTTYNSDRTITTITMNPGIGAGVQPSRGVADRTSEARYALMFEVQNATVRQEVTRLESAARRRDFSAYDQNLSATDARLLTDTVNDEITARHRAVFARERERLEFNGVERAARIETEMTRSGREGSNSYRAQQNWRDFEDFLNHQIDSGHAQSALTRFDRTIADQQRYEAWIANQPPTRSVYSNIGDQLRHEAWLANQQSAQTYGANQPLYAAPQTFGSNQPQAPDWRHESDSWFSNYGRGEYRHVGHLENNEQVFEQVQGGNTVFGTGVTFGGGNMANPQPVPVPEGAAIYRVRRVQPSGAATQDAGTSARQRDNRPPEGWGTGSRVVPAQQRSAPGGSRRRRDADDQSERKVRARGDDSQHRGRRR